MKTKDLLRIIFFSSGGVFISPTSLNGRDDKLASAFRVFLFRNKEYFNVLANHDGTIFYELTKECQVALFGINDTLFIGQSFSQMGFYERLLRSVVAIEMARIIPITKKIISINHANYAFLNEGILSSGKRTGVICDQLSYDLMNENFNSAYVPKSLRNKKISQGVRFFLQTAGGDNGMDLELTQVPANVSTLEKNIVREREQLKHGELTKLWEVLFSELSTETSADISSLFTKNELINLALQMNNVIIDLNFEHHRYVVGNLKHHLLRLISSRTHEEWEVLRQTIRDQGDSFFGKTGSLSSEDEAVKSKLKELIELATTDYDNAMKVREIINNLILPSKPFYSINSFLNIINKNSVAFSGEHSSFVYLIKQFKSTLIMHFINRPDTMKRHSKVIEQIINNDLDIFNWVLLSFITKDNGL